MADDDKKDEQELSEDEKLAAEWEAAMEESGDEGEREDEWAAAMAEAGETGEAEDDVQAAPMEEFETGSEPSMGGGPAPDIDVILDIPVTISMEVGNTQIPIRNLLQLNQGSVIELDRLAGEPLDVLVNGTLIAHGEVVMVNEKFGIRLTGTYQAVAEVKMWSKSIAVLALLLINPAFAQETAKTVAPDSPVRAPDTVGTIVSLGLGLVAVIAVIYGCAWIIRRMNGMA
eukprot:CAMPEP_0181263536 /NCGR_PEP_ID=MMETSP1097-20121128/2645_1 /TAXON_ID=35684 /ORGANISM="Pseudopedinella elastica, Strain CCMP716" /LENGTH=228 /DNA_ID=CAMNT_0023362355 /DNA_START=52 /DNA_END=734 /DNA_ORIENTATION=-